MKGYVRSIEKAARQNATFRTVLLYGEELPIREQGTNAVAWYHEGIASFGGGEFHAIH